MKHEMLRKAMAVYACGGSITEFLRAELDEATNSTEIIELTYDLQAGSYIAMAEERAEDLAPLMAEFAMLLGPHLEAGDSLLDVGTGEFTTIAAIIEALGTPPAELYACDVSWSRLHKGMAFWRRRRAAGLTRLHHFVADMKALPLPAGSVDVITSSHALEPNGANLPSLLAELLRVARKRLVLFEPSYERASREARRRMDRLGYIRGLEGEIMRLGGRVLSVTSLAHAFNPLNPTACYVVEPPPRRDCGGYTAHPRFAIPATGYRLERRGDCFASRETGLAFPMLHGMPVLKEQAAIVASALFADA